MMKSDASALALRARLNKLRVVSTWAARQGLTTALTDRSERRSSESGEG